MLKIAFLFLTITGVNHEAYWKDFFKGYDDYYSLYIHAKEGVPEYSFFKPYEMKRVVLTTWENTIQAQIALLQEALQHSDNAKFIFVSESTIPLQSFERVYAELLKDDKSIFWFIPSPHNNPDNKMYYNKNRRHLEVPLVYEYKNAQWIVLNRKHAQLMANDIIWLPIFCSKVFDNEHYPSSFLALNELLGEVENKHTTYVCWSKRSPQGYRDYPYTFTTLNRSSDYRLLARTIRNGFLFARKFAPTCDLSYIDHLLVYKQ